MRQRGELPGRPRGPPGRSRSTTPRRRRARQGRGGLPTVPHLVRQGAVVWKTPSTGSAGRCRSPGRPCLRDNVNPGATRGPRARPTGGPLRASPGTPAGQRARRRRPRCLSTGVTGTGLPGFTSSRAILCRTPSSNGSTRPIARRSSTPICSCPRRPASGVFSNGSDVRVAGSVDPPASAMGARSSAEKLTLPPAATFELQAAAADAGPISARPEASCPRLAPASRHARMSKTSVCDTVPGYPKRPVPRDEDAAKALKKRTLTNLYNVRPPMARRCARGS